MRLYHRRRSLDCLCFFAVTAIITACFIELLLPNPGQAIALAPIAGFIAAGSSFIQSLLDRIVPKSLSAAPSRFAEEMAIVLNGGLEQMRSFQQVAWSLQDSAKIYADSLNTISQVVRGAPSAAESATDTYLGKGFD